MSKIVTLLTKVVVSYSLKKRSTSVSLKITPIHIVSKFSFLILIILQFSYKLFYNLIQKITQEQSGVIHFFFLVDGVINLSSPKNL